ncbi:hypothetical protein N0V88_006012 [Collariella sp. IMI 366227]|nr:hypothetical protein N0V88_006012 [Collariella sp. IMI 366227]
MASVLSDCKALEHAYNKLQFINEELRYVERELCRLSTFSAVFNLNKSKQSSNWREHALGGFGNQDPWCSDWWQRAMHFGFHESGDKLDRELEKMNASKTKLMPLQSGLRARINRLSRPHLGNLNILDLPDEILLEIFELVEGFDLDHSYPGYFGASRNDIKNSRLVCRRFCDVSSQLLVRLVRVRFDEPSLARLEAISRHPAIAKGVRVVQVVLHFYNRSLTNFNRFLSYHSDELEEVVNVFGHGELWEDAGFPEQVPAEAIADGRAVIATLNRLANPDPADIRYSMGDEDYAAHLKHIHREYLTLYEKQESLISSGKFSLVVGSAIAKDGSRAASGVFRRSL